jgi:hypothetical protein
VRVLINFFSNDRQRTPTRRRRDGRSTVIITVPGPVLTAAFDRRCRIVDAQTTSVTVSYTVDTVRSLPCARFWTRTVDAVEPCLIHGVRIGWDAKVGRPLIQAT